MIRAEQARSWLADFDALVARLETGTIGDVQALCAMGRSKLDAAETRLLAAAIGPDGDDRRAQRLAGRGGARSKQQARVAAKRAAAAAKNASLVDDLAAGELSTEQFDAIADATAADESAATDQGFIDGVKAGTADEAKKLARKRKHKSQTGESEHDRQRRLRTAQKYKDFELGLSVLQLAGDDATINELWNLITERERRLRDADGGRDLPSSEHPRTFDQRLFDAATELLRGTGTGLAGRPSAVIMIPTDDTTARLAGGGPLPDHAVADILARADLSVMIIDHLTSQPLWLARTRRHASIAQYLALVCRDEGCVRCNAPWIRCIAHHLTPWNAPAQGETNIDDLALLCTSCHTDLHAANLTLTRLPDGHWTTRPATAAETPAPRPSQRHDRTATDGSTTRTPTQNTGRADQGRSNGGTKPRRRPQPGSRRLHQTGDDDEAAA